MKRRTFLQLIALLSAGTALSPRIARASSEEDDIFLDLTPDLAIDFTTRFAQNMMDGQCTASNPVLAYDTTGTPIGYTVDVQRNGDSYGYVVLDSRHADIVTRYSFGKDVVSPIEALRGNDSLRRKAPNIGEDNSSKLIMLSPLDFGLANGMLTEYMAFGSAGISKLPAKASSQPKAEWKEIPVPIASFYSNYSPVSQGSLGDFNYTTEKKIMAWDLQHS